MNGFVLRKEECSDTVPSSILLIIGALFILAFVVFYHLMALSSPGFFYTFEERTVFARYLKEARGKLNDKHSPLVETNDPSIV